MSGPKVVRIVTREEIVAICEGHLRRLEQATNQWIAHGKRNGEITDQEIEATLKRQRYFVELLNQDAFVELQRKVPDEIAYLKTDMLRREQLAIEKAASARKRARQARENAAALLSALAVRGKQIPVDLKAQLESIAKGEESQQMESTLASGFGLLTATESVGLTSAQRELAARLAGPEEPQTFEAWKSAHRPLTALASLLDRVDTQIAEAEALVGTTQTARYLERLRCAEVEANDSRQKLLVDSLIVDLSNSIASARAHRTALERLRDIAAELMPYQSEEALLLWNEVAACHQSTSIETISTLHANCQSCLEREAQRKAAQSRREVILQGLARLGYEVNEGMNTAWASNGRVVLRKTSLPGYGVEVGGQAESSRLQVRAVALTSDRDLSRDKDVETIWCGEFSKLQQLVAENGNDLLIERAMAVGQVPLKVVGDVQQQPTSAAQTRTLK